MNFNTYHRILTDPNYALEFDPAPEIYNLRQRQAKNIETAINSNLMHLTESYDFIPSRTFTSYAMETRGDRTTIKLTTKEKTIVSIEVDTQYVATRRFAKLMEILTGC